MLRLTRRQALGAFGGTALALAIPFSVDVASADDQSAEGYLYVNLNTSGANTVAGFARQDDGTLKALPGSPFSIGGAGTGSSIGSQGAVQTANRGRYLLVADAGSSQISVLRLAEDGRLTAVGSPVASGGAKPVSIAVHRNLVYVANGNTNYAGFTLDDDGSLRPIPAAIYAAPDSSVLGDVLFSGDGRHLVGMRVGNSTIDSFLVDDDGRLTAAAGSPFPAQGFGPFGSAFRPTNSRDLFVTLAHNAAGGGAPSKVSAYDVTGNGKLQARPGSPYADDGVASCWLTVSPDGRHVFVANTGSSTISSFAVDANGSLTFLQSVAPRGSKLGLFEVVIAPDGRTLYALEAAAGAVAAFAVDGGNLSELASSPFALSSAGTSFGMAAV